MKKDILDKYATIVIPKSKTGYDEEKQKYVVYAAWKKNAEKYQYNNKGDSDNLCLWIPPPDCIVIEFEGSRKQNDEWIAATINNCIKYNFDYCKCEHYGKSAYIWIFNIDGLKTHEQRKALAEMLIPAGAKIDYSNLGRTLVPIIEAKHWKHSNVHGIVAGKNPLEHKNKLPEGLLCKEQTKTLCDDYNKINEIKSCMHDLSDDTINKILKSDFLVQRLLAGNIAGYNSPSEARMALYFALVGYGLSDSQVHLVCNKSVGLNYHEKPHLHDIELCKARSFCKNKRKIYGR